MKHRWILVGVALLSASAFALSVQSGMWWSVGEVGIGPFGARHCFEGECRASGLSWLGGGDMWSRTGFATGIAALLSMFTLVIVAGAIAAKRTPKLAARAALAAIATTALAGGYFVAAFPGLPGATLARGAYLFFVAIVLGVIVPIVVLRTPRTQASA